MDTILRQIIDKLCSFPKTFLKTTYQCYRISLILPEKTIVFKTVLEVR